MKISLNVPTKVVIKAGEHKATKAGFLFDGLIPANSVIDVSQDYLDEHKAKHGVEFSCSWLERVDPLPEPKPKPRARVKKSEQDDASSAEPETSE